MKLSLYTPIDPKFITQGFGDIDPKYTALGMKGHNGIDYWATDGWPIYATHDGTVTYAGLDGANGNLVVVLTDETFDYNGSQVHFKTLYGHLKTNTYAVKATQNVKAGDLLALADNTGLSTGSHLHFGLKPVQAGEADWQWFNVEPDNGYNGAIDPMPYMNDILASTINPKFVFSRDLSFGSFGSDVFQLQRILNTDKFGNFIPTGFFGPVTKLALQAYQTYHKIDPVGRVGPQTRMRLNA